MDSFLRRFGGILFIAYGVVGVFFLVRIPSTFNGGFDFAVRHLWLPIAVVVLSYTAWRGERLEPSAWKRWTMAVVLCPLLLLFSWPYVLAANTLGGPHPDMTYRGVVTSKFISGARSRACVVEIQDGTTRERVQFVVSPSLYHSLDVGAEYGQTMKRGLFGIPYAERR